MAAMVKTLYNFSGIRVKTVFPYGPHRILNKELFSGVGFSLVLYFVMVCRLNSAPHYLKKLRVVASII